MEEVAAALNRDEEEEAGVGVTKCTRDPPLRLTSDDRKKYGLRRASSSEEGETRIELNLRVATPSSVWDTSTTGKTVRCLPTRTQNCQKSWVRTIAPAPISKSCSRPQFKAALAFLPPSLPRQMQFPPFRSGARNLLFHCWPAGPTHREKGQSASASASPPEMGISYSLCVDYSLQHVNHFKNAQEAGLPAEWSNGGDGGNSPSLPGVELLRS